MPKIKQQDPENPELTAEFFARAQRGVDHLPAGMQQAIGESRRGRGPQKAPTKEQVTLRLSGPVLAAYRSTGRGWQRRMNADLERTASKIVSPKIISPKLRHRLVHKPSSPIVHGGILKEEASRSAAGGNFRKSAHKKR